MRKPSARALTNRVTLYRYAPAQDAEGGVAANPYGEPLAADVPCSVQPSEPMRYVDQTTGRLVQKTVHDVFFRDDHALAADDKIVWVDNAGVTHNLFVLGSTDQAGKGGCFMVSTEERL